tara:strand:+ start:13842 stop:14786 length:945 start_codon:yes stop_codon:yes gene_type:complete
MTSNCISVVIPSYNEQENISQCLESLRSQDYPKEKYEIIVVDNNSEDRTKEIAKKFNVHIIDQKTGPVGAVRNAGAKKARGEYLVFIDADCIAPPDWLARGVEALSSDNSVYGGGYDVRPNPHWIEQAWLLENKTPPKELLGCCIFIKKADFFHVGGFDEKITSGEDTKLSVTLRTCGFDVRITNELSVIHLGNPITLRHFFIRQIWHSENYIQNWADTKTDPTFYLLLVFLLGLASLTLSLLLTIPSAIAVSFFVLLAVPLLFTFKRLHRSKKPGNDLRNLPAIYFLDFVYLSGRVIGLCKSLWKIAMKFNSR